MGPEIQQMLQAAERGDAAAWRRLIEAYSGRVFSLVCHRCGNRELAEEITQATFVRVLQKLADYRQDGQFEAWLFRIALNLLRDEARRKQRQAVSVDFADTPPETIGGPASRQTPEQGLIHDERLERIRGAVGRLPEADREILELRYSADLSFAQIAQVLDEPLGTVLARVHRALKKLRQMLPDI